MMIIRELITRLGFDADDKKIASFENSIKSLTVGLTALVGVASAATAAAFGLAKGASDYGDEVAKTSRIVGLSIEDLQAYRFAFDRAGIGAEELGSSLNIFSKLLGQAQAGEGAAKDTLNELGISLKKANGEYKNTGDLMPDIMDKLKGMTNSAQRAKIATDLFGRSGIKMGTAFAGGSDELKELMKEAERLGGIMSTEDALNAEILNDQITDLKLSFNGLKTFIGAGLMPVFGEMVKELTEFVVINRKLIQVNLKQFFEASMSVIKVFINVLKTLWNWVDRVAQIFGGWENTLKIVGVALASLIALNVAKWVWLVVTAIRALNIAMLLNPAGLMVAAIVALITFIGLLLEDLWQWYHGNESIIGGLIEKWSGFVDTIKGIFTNMKNYVIGIFSDMWNGITSGFQSGVNALKSLLPDFMLGDNSFDSNVFSPSQVASQADGNRTMSAITTDNRTVNVTVPAGTTKEQADYIATAVNQAMGQQLKSAALNLEGY
jgi:hypothetical protein